MPSLTDEEKSPPSVAEATEGQMLLLTVSPGKLGLTIRVDKTLGGCMITAIDPACKFKDRVEVGDRIVTIDGQTITKIADMQINNNKKRSFGVVKKTTDQVTQNQTAAPPSSSQSATNNTASSSAVASTPVPNNAAGNPVVTTEKTTSTKKNAGKQKADETEDNFQVVINCPDRSVIKLSTGQGNGNNPISSHIILGRGKHGIPSSSKVNLQACALRIVEKYTNSDDDAKHALELVALGTERCTVLRDGKRVYVTSVAQMLASGLDTTRPSSIFLRHGDIVQPFDPLASVDNLSLLYKFKVEIVAGGTVPPTTGGADVVEGSAFAAASKKIDEAATMGAGNGEKRQGNPYAKRPAADVVNPYAKRPAADVVNPYAKRPAGTSTNPYATQKPMLANPNPNDKSSEKSAAVPSDVKASGEVAVAQHLFDFDKKSLRRTFLEKSHSTSSFFITYYKNLSKNPTNANKELGNKVLTALVDAMSPQDKTSQDENVVLPSSLENFPLRQILATLTGGKHMELGKRAIEGYIWLSCRKCKRKHSGVDEPSGPTLLLSPHLPLNSVCNSIGWDSLEALLVEAMEMLCKYQNSSRPFDLLEKVQPTASSGSGENAQMRVFSKLAKVAYSKRFTADPTNTAYEFCTRVYHVRQRSQNAGVKLMNDFVDVMSPPDTASRSVPLKAVDSSFPLRTVLRSILVDGKHKELGKRVLKGYVWLSCQKYHGLGSSKPRGPENLAGVLDIACDKIGWGLLTDVLVESVEKLCEFDNTPCAFELMDQIMRSSSRGDSQCSLVCARLAKLTSKKMLNNDRFRSKPTTTANLFLTQYKHLEKDSSNKQFCDELLNSFVDIMSPRDCKRKEPSSQINQDFPLRDILDLLINRGLMELGKRALEGYVWLSSQRVSSWSSGGPTLLCNLEAPVVSLCDALGWNKLEDVLVESIKMLCKHGSIEEALFFVDKIAPPASEGSSHRLRICSKMAKIACDKQIEEFTRLRQYKSASYLPRYKKVLWLVGNYCPAIAPKFVTLAKKLDVNAILYPLLTDVALRSSSSTDAMKKTLNELTIHCAQTLNSRVASNPDTATAWTITNADLYEHHDFGDFLQNQCKKTFDWRVRKSDHRGFEAVLSRLISAGEIACQSYQPGYSGPYHFKITKLKTCRVALSALSCSCSRDRYFYGSRTRQEPTTCLRDTSKTDYQNDKANLDVIKTYLPADSTLKRKADELSVDDDDDVVLTGVAGVAEAVAKRVKAAEDAGEVIEIL